MFTGIIEATGRVMRLERRRQARRLVIAAPAVARRSRRGDSIAVNGVCLSVAGRRQRTLAFDVIPETLRRTTLGTWRPGDAVHVERAMRARGRLHGHLVLGHVDGTARIAAVGQRGRERWIEITAPPTVARYCLPKGSIAVDGVSLTIGQVRGRRLRLYLIPVTLRRTTLRQKQIGDRVNIETDILVKTALQSVKIFHSSARISGTKYRRALARNRSGKIWGFWGKRKHRCLFPH